MKDIQSRPSRPLDLSKSDELALSRHKLDLSDGKKAPIQKSAMPRQTNFYEFMPAAAAANVHDDDFGDKLADWFDGAKEKIVAGYAKASGFLMSAVMPMKKYWAVVLGVGLILGLLIIAYIATHRNWVTSFPANIFALPTAGKGQGDDNKNNSQPGNSVGGVSQTPTPETAEAVKAAEAAKSNSGSAAAAPAATGGSAILPGSGSVTGVSGGTVGGPTGGTSTSGATGPVTNIVQQAPTGGAAPTPAPAPLPAPLPNIAPAPAPSSAPLPLSTTAPLLKTIDEVTAPVTDKLL